MNYYQTNMVVTINRHKVISGCGFSNLFYICMQISFMVWSTALINKPFLYLAGQTKWYNSTLILCD